MRASKKKAGAAIEAPLARREPSPYVAPLIAGALVIVVLVLAGQLDTLCANGLVPRAFGIAGRICPIRTPTQLAKGKTIPVAITLVTTDAYDLACAADQGIGQARCAFQRDGSPASSPEVLAPYMTLDNKLFLIAELWKEPALAARLREEPPSLGREKIRRFTARCQLALEAQVKDLFVRWVPTAAWGARADAWAGRISGCSIAE